VTTVSRFWHSYSHLPQLSGKSHSCASLSPHHVDPFDDVMGGFRVPGPAPRNWQGTGSPLVTGALPNPKEDAWN
jgi:hypothetical protein